MPSFYDFSNLRFSKTAIQTPEHVSFYSILKVLQYEFPSLPAKVLTQLFTHCGKRPLLILNQLAIREVVIMNNYRYLAISWRLEPIDKFPAAAFVFRSEKGEGHTVLDLVSFIALFLAHVSLNAQRRQ